jgi:flavodoxin
MIEEVTMKTLVVFYSRSGRTRRVALRIADSLGGDVEEIVTRKSYRGFLGLCRSVASAIRRAEFAIEPPAKSAQGYDLVVLGAPIWGGRPAEPMMTYLAQTKGTIRKAACFVTSGGAARAQVPEEMAQAAGAVFVGGLALDRSRLRSSDLHASIGRFVDTMKAAAGQ